MAYYRNKLDHLYGDLVNDFNESDELHKVLELIDELQNQIDEL